MAADWKGAWQEAPVRVLTLKKKKNYEEIKVLSFKYTFSEMSLVNTNVILDAYIASSEPVTVKSCREDGVPKGSQITRPGSFLRKDYNST